MEKWQESAERFAKYWAIIMCIFVVRPYYVQLLPLVDDLWAGIVLLLAAGAVCLICLYKRGNRLALCGVFCLMYVIATLFNQRENILSAVSVSAQVMLAFSIGILAGMKAFRENVRFALRTVITFYLYLDVALGLLGAAENWFGLSSSVTLLSYDNYAAYTIVPLLSVKWALDCRGKKQVPLEDWVCWGLCLLYKLLTGSVNAIVVLTLFGGAFYAATRWQQLRRFITPWAGMLLSGILLFSVQVLQVHTLFGWLFKLLGKSPTLNYRTVIWDGAFAKLWDIPFWGYGNVTTGTFQTLIGLDPVRDDQASHAHNMFLDLWFSTGIIGMLLFGLLIFVCLRGLRGRENTLSGRALMVGTAAYFLLGFLDGYPFNIGIYVLLAVAESLAPARPVRQPRRE